MRTLEQWFVHQSQAHPQAIDLGLERSRRVLERLQWQPPSVPVITVAGTNGKGSVAAFCASMLTAAGYRVGTFTSPHLRDYRERIRVHDRLVTSDELLRAFERIEAARLAPPREISLTFFEYNTLAAFLIFEAAKLDAWVLEVGMGGRLDAVNVVDPTVAVVVSIGLDHQEFLGTTLEAIAREKAGIFRKGRCAVLGSRALPPALVDGAAAVGATPKRLGVEFDYTREAAAWHYRGNRWDLPRLPPPALAGETQFANAATAVAALEELESRLPVSAAAVARGLRSVQLVGRFQVIEPGAGKPTWILDVAHNPDAARVLAQNLRASPAGGKTFAVCGILADKDAAAIAARVRDCFDAWWLASIEGERGTSAGLLAQRIAEQISAPIEIMGDVAAACAGASAAAAAADRIVVFGSFHTVGPALDWLDSQGCQAPALPEYTGAPPGQ
ncbi:MAG: bifunctional tetrahydrofolate synthase/dihydrofolate synthase [Pseudomonadota bacterium]|nr:bifunctional tetrahydrofolate synthase/dihydrofolate synthase [Pseudomonadota bacterium]